MQKKIIYYSNSDGSSPFKKWLRKLRDDRARILIQSRIERLEYGNIGGSKPVGSGVFELRITHGPGYRIYFGNDGDTLVIILSGGDKSTQQNDIHRAKKLWIEYKDQKNA